MHYPKNKTRESASRRITAGLLLPFAMSLAVGLAGSSGKAQCPQQESQKLGSPPAYGRDHFGKSVAISGDVAIVGALDEDNFFSTGAVYVYRSNGVSFSMEQKLIASESTPENLLFGRSVAINGNVAIVGSRRVGPGNDGGTAYVYRFDGSTWAESQRLKASDGDGGSFGDTVAFDGTLIIVGATLNDNENGNQAGAAYIYRYDGSSYIEEQKLVASDGDYLDGFGGSVALDGDTIVVGKSNPHTGGAVYIYRFDGASFVEQQVIRNPDQTTSSHFGKQNAISGDTLIIGHSRENTTYVYRFDGSSFMMEQELLASDGSSGSFGSSVAISGDTVLVGKQYGNTHYPYFGTAYLFRLMDEGYVEERKLFPSDGLNYQQFGYRVAIDGDAAIVGAPSVNGDYLRGSAYTFSDLSIDLLTPRSGTVNAGAGETTDVLTINGSSGDERSVVQIGQGEPFTIDLDSAPSGPAQSLYAMYIWAGCPSLKPFELRHGSEMIGTFVNATPLHPQTAPQPLRVLRSPELPGAVSAGVTRITGASRAPFSLPTNGVRTPGTFVFQSLLQDNGADNATRFSVSNAVILEVD